MTLENEAPRNLCVNCNALFDGKACPQCRLRYRPRCPECGSRLYYDRRATTCASCGFPLLDTVFFEPGPADRPAGPNGA